MNRIKIKDPDHLDKVLSSMGKVVAFDTETTSLNITELELDGFSVSDGETSFYCDTSSILEEEEEREYTEIMAKFIYSAKLVIMHNAVFDMKVLRKCFDVCDDLNPYCTYIGANLCNENNPRNGLKDLAVSILKIPQEDIMSYEDAIAYGADSEEFCTYATNDAVWTFDLFRYQVKKLKAQELWYLATKIEMPFLNYLVDMEYFGIGLDKNLVEEIHQETCNAIEALEDSMLKSLGKKKEEVTLSKGRGKKKITWTEVKSPVSFTSPDQMSNLIYDELGIKSIGKTKGGKPSTKTEVLNKLVAEHPFIQMLIDHRSLVTVRNKFTKPLPTFIDIDGRVRPSFNIVKTGRLSASKPPLQCIKKNREKGEVNLRRLFIEDKGYSIIKADYSGQELCLLAEVTGCPEMTSAICAGQDLHLKTANRIFDLGLSEEEINKRHPDFEEIKKEYDLQRYRAKNGANFPIIYGTTFYGVSGRMGVSKDEAKRWIEGFFDLYPGVKEAYDNMEKELLHNGYSLTLMNRRRRFPHYERIYNAWMYERNPRKKYGKRFEIDGCIRQAFNFKVQGSAADMAKAAGGRLMTKVRDYEARAILAVHDELIFGVPTYNAESFAKVVKYHMENILSLSVPIEVDLKIVQRYGD